MTDPTNITPKAVIATGQPQAELVKDTDRRWTSAEMTEEFDVTGILAPFVYVIRRSDRVKGTLEFTHSQRAYFDFQES